MKNKKSLILIALITIICLFGVTYAYFNYYKIGSSNRIVAGKISLILNDGTNAISLSNAFPETKEEARSRTDNTLTFSISGINTTLNQDIYYEIMLNEGDKESGKTRLNPEDLVFDLIELNTDGTEGNYIIDAKSFSDLNARRVWVDTVLRETSTTLNKTYKLRMWISEDVIISNTDPNASYSTEVFENSYASVKVSVYGDFIEKEMPTLLSDRVISTISLTEADVDGTRFVYGETVDNNYLWYSGKLWRIVGINSDGSIKLVTQGNMTAIAWDTSDTNTDYSTSQIRTWLNTEFLPTINADLIVESDWDYTTYSSFPIEKDKENEIVVPNKVGLLSVYDYMMTGGTNSSSTSNTFLNNGYYWWTMSPQTNGSSVWYVGSYGCADTYSGGPTNSFGARPSVNLKSGITILGGTGEKGNPYTLEGDKVTGTTSELLSNRISGEYINFNNTKYRIVGIETINGQKLTKVTMADYAVNSNTIGNSAFGSSSSDITYNITTGIGKYMYDWYNGTSIDSTYKAMIATDGIEWYTGAETSTWDYTLSKTGTTVATPIGLGYYGEMFSSQFGEGDDSSTSTWLITKFSDSYVWYADDVGAAGCISPIYNNGARPSFYLKADVKIIGGTGMPHDPYELADISPVCAISGDTDIMAGSTYTYNIECIDTSGFNDSDITTSDITISDGSVLSVSTPIKTTTSKGYKYAITVTPLAAGIATISLNAGSVSDTSGNSNSATTSSTITVTADTTAPVCTISGDTDMMVGNTYTYNIECIDTSGFNDSDITTSDITISDGSVLSVSTPIKTTTSKGYKYAITVTPLAAGTATISLNAGSVSDSNGNTNNAVTSSTITVTKDTTAPKCTISGDTAMLVGNTYTYNIECTDTYGFNDSEIIIDDITVSNNTVLSVGSVVKSTITDGYKYALMITPLTSGTTTISLNAGSVSDTSGNSNIATTSSTITVTADTTAPVCTISGDTDMTVGETYTYNIECTDTYGFNDSEITTSDITISNSSVLSVSTPVKSTITNGYKYAITVTPLAAGTTTISLDAGSVSDTSDNGNIAVTSSTITVTESITASAPVCAFTSSSYEFDAANDMHVDLILECTSEDGFNDSEIVSDDFEVKVDGAIDEYSYIETPVKTAIDNGYRYTMTFYFGPDILYDISLKANSVTSSSGAGNTEVYTQVKDASGEM